jgi:predicted RNA-binding Zn-ribbon protein involved in translation (DUF1610 family)
MEALVYTCDRCGFMGCYDPKVKPNIGQIRRCPSCNAERELYRTDGEVYDALR